MMKLSGPVIRAAITLVLLGFTAWWLGVVASDLDVMPARDSAGDVVDSYQRAKDILLVVLPLLTSALGYWFGVAGRAQAEAKAVQADAAAERTNLQLKTVLDTSTEPGLLDKARRQYPEAFEATSRG
ncbi:hypothetical protein ACQP1O_36925 [Nocardia sp. CA-151230]|uniref:hypothetical protein n=1 Tax=Nocardia sp. CA-151230 TaxID=3239982 RepID=UPI003D8F9DFE